MFFFTVARVAGLCPSINRYFDPKFIVWFLSNQRGAGKSTPHARLERIQRGTVADIERTASIWNNRCKVFGGSGEHASLAYAETLPTARANWYGGIFLAGQRKSRGSNQAVKRIFPDVGEIFESHSRSERDDMVSVITRD